MTRVESCRGCAQSAQEERTQRGLRIEVIKQKILDKLRMTRPPNLMKPRRPVPKSILNEMAMYGDDRELYSEEEEFSRMDEFFAKESQMIVFADIGKQ